jgi:tripartite-type tricarboxylate transporter receptor subunit TctC
MAGHLNMMFEMGYAALPSIQSGRVRPIAVTSAQRISILPDVPTMSELGVKDFESYNWQGIIVPAGTPAPIISKLNQAFNEILKDPDVAQAISSVGSQAVGGSPESFGAFIAAETDKWAKVIKAANIKLN